MASPEFGSMTDLAAALQSAAPPVKPPGSEELTKMIQALSTPKGQFDERFGAADAAQATGSFKGFHMGGGNLQPSDQGFMNFTSSIAPNGIPWQNWPQSTHVEDRRGDPNQIHYQTDAAIPDLIAAMNYKTATR